MSGIALGNTVSRLKEIIAHTTRVPSCKQVLMHQGKILNRCQDKLISYGIGYDDSIHLTLRMKGGSPERESAVATVPSSGLREVLTEMVAEIGELKLGQHLLAANKSVPLTAFPPIRETMARKDIEANVGQWERIYRHNTEVCGWSESCLLYTSPSPRDQRGSRMPSSA